MQIRTLLALSFALSGALSASCSSSPPAAGEDEPAGPQGPKNPSEQQVILSTTNGWRADLVLDQGKVGIWTVGALKVFPQYGSPEIVGLDDLGRCHVLWSYSGKWTPVTIDADVGWLGGLAQGDVDPRVPGRELYVGSRNGNVFEVVSYPDAGLDYRRIANLERREVHTLVAADVSPEPAGDELLAFTSPPALFLLVPRSDGLDGYREIGRWDLLGRIRDALVLPRSDGGPPVIATASRSGAVELLRFDPEGSAEGSAMGSDWGPRWTTIHQVAMGRGRLAMRPTRAGAPLVLYSTADDGTIWRHEQGPGESWKSELIFAGPEGPRGVAAGRFDADPEMETVVVFGYDRQVHLLRREPTGWSAETIFEDRDKGHWIAAAELDGRNATDEIVCSGYGGRIVLLSRPAGSGLEGVLRVGESGK
jgi:hypothetical protein